MPNAPEAPMGAKETHVRDLDGTPGPTQTLASLWDIMLM